MSHHLIQQQGFDSLKKLLISLIFILLITTSCPAWSDPQLWAVISPRGSAWSWWRSEINNHSSIPSPSPSPGNATVPMVPTPKANWLWSSSPTTCRSSWWLAVSRWQLTPWTPAWWTRRCTTTCGPSHRRWRNPWPRYCSGYLHFT